MATLLDLAKRLEKRADELESEISEVAKLTALFLVRELVANNPVDTTTSLSNWVVSLGEPTFNFIDPHVPGFNGYTYTASANETFRLAELALQAKRPGQSIFISNNAPYIVDLNAGSSKQAPAGWVDAAVIRARRKAKEFYKQVRKNG